VHITAVHKAQPGWRRIIAQAVLWGIPTPAFSTALAFFDGYRSEVVPANLLQAQRDYFGAHTFRVMPGKENDRLKAGEDIRTSSDIFHFLVLITASQTSTGLAAVAMSRPPPTLLEYVNCRVCNRFQCMKRTCALPSRLHVGQLASSKWSSEIGCRSCDRDQSRRVFVKLWRRASAERPFLKTVTSSWPLHQTQSSSMPQARQATVYI
jgi:hypothetical protein